MTFDFTLRFHLGLEDSGVYEWATVLVLSSCKPSNVFKPQPLVSTVNGREAAELPFKVSRNNAPLACRGGQ
eukprot:CAMPEP_0114629124 /NCGR_PEP_ID=MMETSP0168-20121206/13192_1 /TAXON_ID=95228 ORGANISM="Vannella sp., Strain DIVA3 517/6/12" /NCGR_SAMPLE_ID=MMETSP0168 /ASSEMBLY_ACC=CAM_ASM_000044 /LENGTH=70 /DNA_ID=CAMNT_0001840563 /DNA_START=26 /DNA_END=238 /DNA_ORIENTATION=-